MAASKKRRSLSRVLDSVFSLPPKSAFSGFALRFAVFFGVPYALLHLLPLTPLLEVLAELESALLQWAGVESVRFGAVLSSNVAWFEIVPDCSGLVMVILLGALLWSTPVRQPERFFVVFAPALFAFNVVRLFAVLYVGGVFGQGPLDAVHLGLWMVDAGIVLALWWTAFSRGSKPAPAGRTRSGKRKTRRV